MPTFGRGCFGEISRDSPTQTSQRHARTCGVGGILPVDPPRRANRKLLSWQSCRANTCVKRCKLCAVPEEHMLAYMRPARGTCMFPKSRILLRILVPQVDIATLRDSAMHCSYHDTRSHDKRAATSRKNCYQVHTQRKPE